MKPFKKNSAKLIVFSILFGLLFASAAPVFAAGIFEQMVSGFTGAAQNAYGIGQEKAEDPNAFSNNLISIINYLLTFLGIVFFLITLYAGWLWLTARGNTEEVEKAKKILQEAIIALIIVLLARLITELVLTQIGAVIYSTQ